MQVLGAPTLLVVATASGPWSAIVLPQFAQNWQKMSQFMKNLKHLLVETILGYDGFQSPAPLRLAWLALALAPMPYQVPMLVPVCKGSNQQMGMVSRVQSSNGDSVVTYTCQNDECDDQD